LFFSSEGKLGGLIERLGGWEIFTLLRTLFSSARAGEFVVLSARGFVASLLTRSHSLFFSSEGKLGGLIERLGGWEIFTLLRALFSSARAGEFVVLSARGFVASLLTRSHGLFLSSEGKLGGLIERFVVLLLTRSHTLWEEVIAVCLRGRGDREVYHASWQLGFFPLPPSPKLWRTSLRSGGVDFWCVSPFFI
jgi:hypothetical protein